MSRSGKRTKNVMNEKRETKSAKPEKTKREKILRHVSDIKRSTGKNNLFLNSKVRKRKKFLGPERFKTAMAKRHVSTDRTLRLVLYLNPYPEEMNFCKVA